MAPLIVMLADWMSFAVGLMWPASARQPIRLVEECWRKHLGSYDAPIESDNNQLENSYSCRSVFIGSTLAARLAGIHAAKRQATTITTRLERYATGSVTRTITESIAPASVASRSLANDAASAAPASTPNRTGRVLCANINCVTR